MGLSPCHACIWSLIFLHISKQFTDSSLLPSVLHKDTCRLLQLPQAVRICSKSRHADRHIIAVAGEPNVPIRKLLPIVASFAFLTTSALAQDITFSPTDRTVPYPAHSFIQGDFNSDGFTDFLGVSPSLDIYAYKSDGVGGYSNWLIPTAYCPANPLAGGDFKHNGKND